MGRARLYLAKLPYLKWTPHHDKLHRGPQQHRAHTQQPRNRDLKSNWEERLLVCSGNTSAVGWMQLAGCFSRFVE
jgi:hypothetical protein